jgi:hypothetical protein
MTYREVLACMEAQMDVVMVVELLLVLLRVLSAGMAA